MEVLAACHVHSEWSYDGSWSLPALHDKFSGGGYRVLMMTEHDRGFTATRHDEFRQACAAASSERLLMVPGIEYSDAANRLHVLVWGTPFIGEALPTRVVLDAVKEAKGIAVLAHPARKEAWRYFDPGWADGLLGIELWNRKYDGWAPADLASPLLHRAAAVPFVGLDFHTRRQWFPLSMALDVQGPITEETVLHALRSRECYPRAFGVRLNHYLFQKMSPALEFAERGRRAAATMVRSARARSHRSLQP